jgi:hypothetical protein
LGLRLAIAEALERYQQQLPGKQLAHRLPLAIDRTNTVRTANDRRDFIAAVNEKFRSTQFPG